MNFHTLISVQRKLGAEVALRIHDSMPRQWRDLANEYGEEVVQLYRAGAHYVVAQALLEAQTSHPTRLS